MTRLLERAVQELGALPEDQQDAIASDILRAIESEEAWEATLARNSAEFERMAEEAAREEGGVS